MVLSRHSANFTANLWKVFTWTMSHLSRAAKMVSNPNFDALNKFAFLKFDESYKSVMEFEK